eukprot:COSAG04_NODE_1784_length_5588_cov_2.790854_2_plen_237_part_00
MGKGDKKDKKSSRAEKREAESESAGSDASEDEEDISWIQWFCSLKGNEFFCEVDEDYIQDDFNLTGLASQVPYYEYALDTILDIELSADESLTEEQSDMIESASELLYGLIHARFILTSRGMAVMLEKFQHVDFGRCPRVYCQGQPCLPVGQSDVPRQRTVKIFCPKCDDIYFPKQSRHMNLDGCYFGTTFPHLFLHMYGDQQPPLPTEKYTARIYGFKLHSTFRDSPHYTSYGRR